MPSTNSNTAGLPLSIISTDLDNGVGRGTEDSDDWGKLIAAFKGFKETHPGMLFGCVKNDGPNSLSLRCVCTAIPNGYGDGADFNTPIGSAAAGANSFVVHFRSREAFDYQSDHGNDIAANDVLTVGSGGCIDFFIEAYPAGILEDANANAAQTYLLFFADETVETFNSTRGSLTLACFFGSLEESSLLDVSALVVAPTPVG